jgi:hypothetical protein
VKGAVAVALLLLAGCSFGRPDRERLGDAAWHEARWTDAMTNYQAAGDAPRITAKYAEAALQAGSLSESADAWTRLGTTAPERAAEAAAGLARVADLAEQDGRPAAITAAVLGLRQIAPTWPVGRMAGRISRIDDLLPAQVVDAVPALLAASPDRPVADSLLLTLGRAERVLGACDRAVPVLDGVVRRESGAALGDSATHVAGACELILGLAALQGNHPGDAERWLDHAAQRLPDGVIGRRALVGYGDARAQQGDSVGARGAWHAVALGPGAPDSVTQLALLRLAELAPAVIGDSTLLHPVH